MSQNYQRFRDHAVRHPPLLFVVLGSGQGLIGERIGGAVSLRFADVPHMPSATVAGHKGQFTLGTLAGVGVLVSEGRVHGYEGHGPDAIIRPVQVAAELGARFAILTNAAGGIRGDLGPGALMPINAHMDWREGPTLSGAESPYCPALLGLIVQEAANPVWPGTYVAVSGPSYETPAEVRALRRLGADAVGMSTVPEARAATELGLRCAAISLITNRAAGLSTEPIDHAEVLTVARQSGRTLADWLERVAVGLAKLHQ